MNIIEAYERAKALGIEFPRLDGDDGTLHYELDDESGVALGRPHPQDAEDLICASVERWLIEQNRWDVETLKFGKVVKFWRSASDCIIERGATKLEALITCAEALEGGGK